MGCIVHGDAKSRTGLSDFHFHFLSAFIYLCQALFATGSLLSWGFYSSGGDRQ